MIIAAHNAIQKITPVFPLLVSALVAGIPTPITSIPMASTMTVYPSPA